MASNADIRNLLDNGPSDLSVLQNFVTSNRTDLGVVLADLASTGQMLVRHLAGIEQILELYPALLAGGTRCHPDGTASPGLRRQLTGPARLRSTRTTGPREGYEGTPSGLRQISP